MSKQKSFYQFDKDTGFWGVPNLSREYVSDLNEEPMYISNNQYGFRSFGEYNMDAKDNIVVIGGSHSWGAGVETRQRYSEVLSKRLDKQVINMGQASLGIDQICVAIMTKSQQFNPKVLIVEQYPWAILRINNNYVNGYIKPSFSLNKDGDVVLNKPPFVARYKIFRKIMGAYRSYKKELNEYKAGINLSHNYDPMLDPIFLSWKSSYYANLYKLLKRILVVIKDYCQVNGIKLVFIIGTTYQQFEDAARVDQGSKLVDYELPKKKLQKILDELNIEYIDSTPEMLSQHTKDDPVIFPDGHINAKGHLIFSDLIEKFLKNESKK